MKKTIISILALAMLLVTNTSVFAAQEQKVSLGFNKVTVKLNGTLFKGNNISYDGTTYVPVRNISALLKFPVHYYASTKTAYIGTVPAGEVPESVLKDWAAMDAKGSSSSSSEKIEKKRDAKVTVKINDITVKVNGKKVASNNLVYNGTTYAPMRAVATMLGINVYFHEPTSTAYLGTVPKDELTAAPPKKSTNMYDTAASGEMAGWRVLVGHEYADVARIYFKANGTIITTKVVDIRKVDYNKKVTWTDDNGIKYTNTVRELYQLFLLTSEYSSDWLHKKFGKIYDDWFIVSTIKADDIVRRYLEDTGKLKPIDDGISLRPDSEFKVVEPKTESQSIDDILDRMEGPEERKKRDASLWITEAQLKEKYNITVTRVRAQPPVLDIKLEFTKEGSILYTANTDHRFGGYVNATVEADGITIWIKNSALFFEIADLQAQKII